MLKFILLLVTGVPVLVWSLLMATHRPLQDWLYRRDNKGPLNRDSAEYKEAAAHMMIRAGGGVLLGGLMIIYALAKLGLLD